MLKYQLMQMPLIRLMMSHYVPKQWVSTWSTLATAFNTKPQMKRNFLMESTGLFNNNSLRKPSDFANEASLLEFQMHRLVKLATNRNNSTSTLKMVEIFDELSNVLCKVADMAEFIRLGHPDPIYASTAENLCINVSGLVEKLNTDRELYEALQNVVLNKDSLETDDLDKHVSNLFLFDFEQSGIHLAKEPRKKVVELNEYALHLGQVFMANCGKQKAVPKKDLPEDIWKYFSTEGENIIVTGLYADCPNDLARKAAYKIYLYSDKQQERILNELLAARFQLAQLCGFPTYSHRALKASTAETPEFVMEFMDVLSEYIKPRAQHEYNIMQAMKDTEQITSTQRMSLQAWDTPYFTTQMKNTILEGINDDISPYFSLGACMDGLNNLFLKLFGISLVHEEVIPGEVWHPDVYKLKVMHPQEGLLGYIYCDFYERSGKAHQDCHFTIQGGKLCYDGQYQHPIVVLMLNFPTPSWKCPSLLTPGMVDNLFHEMGHALHSMLARTKYQHITGTRCSTDFAEVPSILMEYFAADARVVASFARHHDSGEPLSEVGLQALCSSKHVFPASEMQLQVFYSVLDQKYHGHHPLKGNLTQTLQQVQEEYYGLPYVPDTAWQLRFSHLVGYGAKYYSYLFSRAIASGIWQKYFQQDPFSRDAGEKYRRECLAHGGGKPSRQLVTDYLGQDVSPVKLASLLSAELDKRNTP